MVPGRGTAGAGVSGNSDELRGRMQARQRRSRFRNTAVGGLALVAAASGMGLVAALLWHQVGPSRPAADQAAPYVQAD